MDPTEPDVGGNGSRPPIADVDVLVVGAGVTGIYQLHLAREAGFPAQLIEAGDGVGGTWYWNRYPEARFDSESYTYGYIFSRRAVREWEWTRAVRRAAGDRALLQPRRRHASTSGADIHFGARVTSAVLDEPSGTWTVRASDGSEVRTRFLIAATGGLSVPYIPDVPGRDDFRGESYHTGLLAEDAGRLRRQARRRRRHRIERCAADPRHRRRGRVDDGVPAQRQLVHAAQQRTDHGRRAAAAERAQFEKMVRILKQDRERVPPSCRTTGPRSTTTATSAGRSTRRCGTAPASRS